MNTEALKTAREELAAAGLAADAKGLDPMPFYAAADAMDDAIRAAEAHRLIIAADAATYWG